MTMRDMAIICCCFVLAACGKSVIGEGDGDGKGGGISLPVTGGGGVNLPATGGASSTSGGEGGAGGAGSAGELIRFITMEEKAAVAEEACAGWAYEPEGLPAK